MKKIIWYTGLNFDYYERVFSQVIDSWSLLPGDVRIYSDDIIENLKNDTRLIVSQNDYTISKKLNHMEFKFFKKSRSIVNGIKENIGNGYLITNCFNSDNFIKGNVRVHQMFGCLVLERLLNQKFQIRISA